ncbi:hypothetical protein HYW46_02045 [Candidatus Daviesbacteria bacterium]|nr:hypothetical protein [Candidatus Daviesbacteria bacterium]
MAEQDSKEPEKFDFERLMRQNLPDLEIDLGADDDTTPESVQSSIEIGSESSWKKPNNNQLQIFGGSIYSWKMPMPLFIIEDILPLFEDLRAIKVKGNLLTLSRETFDQAGAKIYLPDGQYSTYVLFFTLWSQNIRTNPATGGLIILRNPNVSLPGYADILQKSIARTNLCLKDIGDPLLPDYLTI